MLRVERVDKYLILFSFIFKKKSVIFPQFY